MRISAACLAVGLLAFCFDAHAAAVVIRGGTGPAIETWKTTDLNTARGGEKPMLLYVYDRDMKKSNDLASFYEGVAYPVKKGFFADPKVSAALSGVQTIKIPTVGTGWPANLLAGGANGAALYLLAADGSVIAQWVSGGDKPSPAAFAQLVAGAVAANQQVVDKMKANPPAKFVDAPKPVVAEAKPAEKQEEAPKKNTMPGLANAEKPAGDAPKPSDKPAAAPSKKDDANE